MSKPRSIFVLLAGIFSAYPLLAGARVEAGPAGRISPKAAIDTLADCVIPEVLAGGPWKTSITLMNLQDTEAKVRLVFADSAGSDLAFPFVGVGSAAGLIVTIPGHGSYTVETVADQDAPVVEGWGLLVQDGYVSGTYGKVATTVSLHYGNSEAFVPLTTVNEQKTLLSVDNTGGVASSAVLVSLTAANIQVRVFSEGGELLGTSTFPVPAAGRLNFDFSQVEALQGKRVIAEFTTDSQFMAVLGLRVNAEQGTLTTYSSASLGSWRAY
jgi:hypothetical protein